MYSIYRYSTILREAPDVSPVIAKPVSLCHLPHEELEGGAPCLGDAHVEQQGGVGGVGGDLGVAAGVGAGAAVGAVGDVESKE